MFVQITRPNHFGVDRSKTAALLFGCLFMPFNETAAARALGSFIVCSGILAAFLR
jgi:hypothetical protein